jgi:hypothetical protein
VGDHDDRRLVVVFVGRQVFNGLLHHPLAVGVQSGGGLIEDDNFGFPHEGPSNRDALLLAAAEIASLFTHDRQELLGEALGVVEELHASRSHRSLFDFLLSVIFKSVDDVFFDCAGEESSFLIDQANLFPEIDGVDVSLFVGPVEDAASSLYLVELLDEFDYGRLA